MPRSREAAPVPGEKPRQAPTPPRPLEAPAPGVSPGGAHPGVSPTTRAVRLTPPPFQSKLSVAEFLSNFVQNRFPATGAGYGGNPSESRWLTLRLGT